MGQIWSETRSPGQILEKPCVCSGCHNFSLILLKVGQNIRCDDICIMSGQKLGHLVYS